MDLVLFLTFSLIAVVCALNMALQRHPVSSALSLIGVMVSLAVLYVLHHGRIPVRTDRSRTSSGTKAYSRIRQNA